MAEKNRYPQIPSTVWWGVRSILQRTPNAAVDERMLGVQLGVQEAAARQYVAELKNVGILTDENRATPLAQRWRLDDTYMEAVRELATAAYPEGLLHVAPPGEADRQKIVSWFLQEGLGQGTAGNKAATYLLLTSPTPNEAPARGTASQSRKEASETTRQTPMSRRVAGAVSSGRTVRAVGGAKSPSHPLTEGIPLNVNVQIHISADAGSEQIESIFSAMRRYLYDAPGA
jgi:hypothetical protein